MLSSGESYYASVVSAAATSGRDTSSRSSAADTSSGDVEPSSDIEPNRELAGTLLCSVANSEVSYCSALAERTSDIMR